MNELLTSRYWFGQALPGFHSTDYVYLAYAVLLVIVGIGLVLYKRSTKDRLRKDLISRWYHFAFTIGILGLLWTLFRYELVRTLSLRAVIFAIYTAGDIWLIYLLKYTLVDYKKKRELADREEQKRKYM
jgi:hypothetical protein